MNRFEIVIPCLYNPLLDSTVVSVLDQQYNDFGVHIVVDPPEPYPALPLEHELSRRFRHDHPVNLKINSVRKYALANIADTIKGLHDESIVVIVDGDGDLLASDRILKELDAIYEKHSPLVTYGGQVDNTKRADLYMSEYTISHPETYRKCQNWTHHLFTFRKWLFDKINKDDFIDRWINRGHRFVTSYDKAVMYPLVEMAGVKNLYHTKLPWYIYNNKNPDNDWKVRKAVQDETSGHIKWDMKEYAPL